MYLVYHRQSYKSTHFINMVMRQYIDIVESLSGHSPIIVEDLSPISYFRSSDYINYLIKEWKWHDEGSTLDRWIEDHEFLTYDSPNELLIEELEKFLVNRLDRIDHQLGYLNGSTHIERSLIISKDAVDDFFKEGNGLGKYWATDDSHAYWGLDHANPVDVLITTTLSEVTVDWKITIATRIDYDLGDDEYEIRLVEGSPIKSLTKSFVDGDDVSNLSDGKKYVA